MKTPNDPDVTDSPERVARGSSSVSGSAIRPHEEQTPLERVLRSHLWYPNDILARGQVEMPKCVKAKEYQEAADWQKLMRKAEREIKDWTYILELYEQERKSPNTRISNSDDTAKAS